LVERAVAGQKIDCMEVAAKNIQDIRVRGEKEDLERVAPAKD
jgi:hypothetical protein